MSAEDTTSVCEGPDRAVREELERRRAGYAGRVGFERVDERPPRRGGGFGISQRRAAPACRTRKRLDPDALRGGADAKFRNLDIERGIDFRSALDDLKAESTVPYVEQ